jgi:hypothetical protein
MAYTLEQLSDLQAIRDAAHRYCRGVDRLDVDEMKRAYWPDAVDDHGVFVGNAWEFAHRVVASHDRWRATMHCIANHHIELDANGTTARGEIYNISYLFAAGSTAMATWFGRYLDRYEKRGDEWRIAYRVCLHESTRADATCEPMAIDAAAFRQGSSDRATPGRPVGP